MYLGTGPGGPGPDPILVKSSATTAANPEFPVSSFRFRLGFHLGSESRSSGFRFQIPD